MASRTKRLSEWRLRASSSPSSYDKTSPPSSPASLQTAYEPCVRGWWRDTFCSASKEFNANLPAFTSHLTSLHSGQKHMHLLARKCTQARLYPNSASPNCKYALKAQLSTLMADMDFAAKLHDTYSAVLVMYTFSIQTVIDSLKVSEKECRCSEYTVKGQQWAVDTHADVLLEAVGPLVIRNWNVEEVRQERNGWLAEDDRCAARAKGLKGMAMVKKYFLRQMKQAQEAEDGSNVSIRGTGTKDEDGKEEDKRDISLSPTFHDTENKPSRTNHQTPFQAYAFSHLYSSNAATFAVKSNNNIVSTTGTRQNTELDPLLILYLHHLFLNFLDFIV
ncbi:hypothetical protein BU25DRAFT_419321 [Macroventuria anomochaeta]|uniref:Uncharacterized protein n=1 Tax=Macroventuria anomochaeta TaxID=301207 RepID=A0ACB6S843_9PLEO|nr:uncharacterized protein BU25DRAFT_419321 [Macroventuria anomochaeta]KAF2630311.1 hypothetical protein BU25DRAFT_419321 [Macroventuria anomochaeta]